MSEAGSSCSEAHGLMPVCYTEHAAGLPASLYLGEDGTDVRAVKLLELDFVLEQEHGACVLSQASHSPGSGGNEDHPAPLPAGELISCTEPGADVVSSDCLACDSMQHALAVAAFWHGQRCLRLSDADRKWRSYMGGLREELACSRVQWDELQALFTVEPASHNSASGF